MSIGLNKITVPNAGANSNEGLLMPKLQYRFRVRLINFGTGTPPNYELTKQVMDVTRPNLTFENMPIEIYNSKVNLAGKHTWNPVTLNLRDDVSNNVQAAVSAQIQKQFDFAEQSAPVAGQDYKFRMDIDILDGGNGAVEERTLDTWALYGCYVTEVNYNTLAYANNEPVQITLNIQYDNAIQNPNDVTIDGPLTNNTTGVGG
jgi:hypothetical protein